MYIKEENQFPAKQKFDPKTHNMFDNILQKCFLEGSP